MMRRSTLIMALLLCAPAIVAAQTPAPEDADALYLAQKWEESAKAYETITTANPTNARAWYRLGVSLNSLRRYTDAADALFKAIAIAHRPEPMFELAHSYALLKDKELPSNG